MLLLNQIFQPQEAITNRARTDSTTVTSSLSDNDLNAARNAAAGKDAALVFITADSGEYYITVENHRGDRNDLKAWHNGVCPDESMLATSDVDLLV